MYSAIHSTFPKNTNKLALKKAIDNHEMQKISAEDLELVRETTRTTIIQAQLDAGINVIGDGMLDWVDEVNPMFTGQDVERGDMRRYFNTNFLYRRPRVRSIEFQKYIFGGEAERICRLPWQAGKTTAKFCVTGPFSLLEMSDFDAVGNQRGAILSLFSEHVAWQIANLLKNFGYVQINEPALAFAEKEKHAEFLLALRQLFGWVEFFCNSRSHLRRLIVSAPYGPWPEQVVNSIWEDYAFDSILHVDCVEGKASIWQLIQLAEKEKSKKLGQRELKLQMGLLDAKSTKMEHEKDMLDIVETCIKQGGGLLDPQFVTTSCGLEFLSWDKAIEKLALTKSVTDLCNWSLEGVRK